MIYPVVQLDLRVEGLYAIQNHFLGFDTWYRNFNCLDYGTS